MVAQHLAKPEGRGSSPVVIRSGAADTDTDGYISLDDARAYAYAFDHIRAIDAQQTPQRCPFGPEGTILLARNPAGHQRSGSELSPPSTSG